MTWCCWLVCACLLITLASVLVLCGGDLLVDVSGELAVATVGWFFSLTFGHCAVCGLTPQQHIFLLSLSVHGAESSWLMQAKSNCNRLARRRVSH